MKKDNWIPIIFILTFILAFVFGAISNLVSNMNALLLGILLIVIILIGIIFDMIGVSVTAASIKPFNSMASKKIRGSKTAIFLIQNAEKVSAFCNDVIGDVCGIISGSVGILISNVIALEFNLNVSLVTLILTALIAAITIGGKALGKSYAINKSDVIVFRFAKIVSLFMREVK